MIKFSQHTFITITHISSDPHFNIMQVPMLRGYTNVSTGP